jgi:glycosyltransferase involved in cell wall biosynthesis
MSNLLRTIAVDLTPVLPGGENGGAKVFVLELLGILAEMEPETRFILLTQESAHKELSFLDRPNVRRMMVRRSSAANPSGERSGSESTTLLRFFHEITRTTRRVHKSFKKRVDGVKRFQKSTSPLRDMGVDLLFCPFTAPTYFEPGIPTVCTIYDLQYKTYPEFFADKDVAHRNQVFIDACSRATLLTAISDYSSESAITHGNLDPTRIRTIYLRMAHRINAEGDDNNGVLERLGLAAKRYLIYPANFWKHKNHEMLFTAFGIACYQGLAKDIKLVCTGAPGERQTWLMSVAKTMNLGDRIIFPGYLPDAELSILMANATGEIFPSLYEGFGLPVIEAMAAGIPVACSNSRSLPEIASGAALLFDPGVPTQIAQAIRSLEEDELLRTRLILAGKQRATEFSDSHKMAKEYWELFQHALVIHNQKSWLSGVWTTHSLNCHDSVAVKERYFEGDNASRLKVSIITPSFNQGQFIERTLLSVAKQTGSEIEHVVFDGGSTDNTVEILKRFNPPVRWVSETDRGQTDAVNKGILATNGEIIGWLNSDDIYYPGAIARVVAFFKEHPDIDVVYGQADHIDVSDHPFEEYPSKPWDFEHLHQTCFICQPALFFRRRVVEKHGLLDESLNYCMDYEYWLRLSYAGVRFAYLEEKLAGSRLYPDNKTLGARVKVHCEINDMFKKSIGNVPKKWLKGYARVSMHERLSKFPTSQIEFDIRYLFAKLRWNGRIK